MMSVKGTSNCGIGSGVTGAAFSTTGYNIADDTSCGLTGTGDRQGAGINPNLGPLKDNLGPTDGAPGATSACLTEALPASSIAIDTGDPSIANNPATDERHVSRPQGATSDVGAYELIPAPVSVALPKAGRPVVAAPGQLTVIGLALLAVFVASLFVFRLRRAPTSPAPTFRRNDAKQADRPAGAY